LLVGNGESRIEEKYMKKLRHTLNPLFEDSLNVEEHLLKGREERA
jgi:hypothetical protein